jgi:hypothetical protein
MQYVKLIQIFCEGAFMRFIFRKMPLLALSVMLSLLIIVSVPQLALADWSTDTTVNTPVTTAPDTQGAHFIVADGGGGFFAVWHDKRNLATTNFDIYAQHFDTAGNALWAANGVAVCTANSVQHYPKICADGEGGCIISWVDHRVSSEIYLQKLNGNGVSQWTVDGIPATLNDSAGAFCPWLVSDGQGGAFVSWNDNAGVDVQRLDKFGNRWTSEVTVSQDSSADAQKLISDGQGGIVITWVENRGATGNDVIVQRLGSTGNKLWGDSGNGILISDIIYSDSCPRIIRSSTGAIIIWQNRDPAATKILAQKVDVTGAPQWTANGVCVFPGPAENYEHEVASDNAGGAIITWVDKTDNNVYAGRVDSNGNLPWGNPVPMMSTGDFSDVSDAPWKTVEDGAGGAITLWVNDFGEVYVQRVSLGGQVLWGKNGGLLCNAEGRRWCPRLVGSGGTGTTGAVAYWGDSRNGATTGDDIYMQGVTYFGSLGSPFQQRPEVGGVGGEAQPISKLAIMAPWFSLLIVSVMLILAVNRLRIRKGGL